MFFFFKTLGANQVDDLATVKLKAFDYSITMFKGTRYPIYRKGNPQLRVFLPNFWMKIVKPVYKQPPNIVQFVTSTEMTNYDIKNYLEKIYNVPVLEVRSDIVEGKFSRDSVKGYVKKEDDFRRAFVTLKEGETFEFPDIISKKMKEDESETEKVQNETKETYKQYEKRNKDRLGLPGWFSM